MNPVDIWIDSSAVNASIERVVAAVEKEVAETFMAKLGLEIFNDIAENALVDTGRYRGSTTFAVGAPDTSVLPPAPNKAKEFYPSPGVPSAVNSVTVDSSIYINNSLPYAQVIEFGGPTMSPQKTFTLAVDRAERWAEAQRVRA